MMKPRRVAWSLEGVKGSQLVLALLPRGDEDESKWRRKIVVI
jgi:hypothetical protein